MIAVNKQTIFKGAVKMDSQYAIYLLKQLVVKHGQVRHNEALELVCADLKDCKKTVRVKRPVQQSKCKISARYSEHGVGIL